LRVSIVLRLALKDLKGMVKERTFVSVMVLLIFVTSFSSVITFGILTLYNPEYVGFAIEKEANVALVGNAPMLEKIMKVKKYDSLQKAFRDFYEGDIDAIIVANESSKSYLRVYLPKEEIKAIQTSLFIKEKLVKYEKELRRRNSIPIFELSFYAKGKRIDLPQGVSISFKFIYVVLIPLLMITTAVSAAGLLIDSMTEEIETKTLELLKSSPLSSTEISIGKILASYILSATLTPIWIILVIANGIDIHNVALVFSLSLSFSLMLISLAYTLSVVIKDRERSQLVFSIVIISIIPLLFTNPFSPVGLVGRIAANGYFSLFEPIVYLITSLIVLLSLVKILKI